MTNRAITLFNQLRPVSVGFDNVFDHFERMFEDDFLTNVPAFPHYNIVKTGDNKYDIEIALAGYNKKDIEVELKEGILTIKSKKEEKEDNKSRSHPKPSDKRSETGQSVRKDTKDIRTKDNKKSNHYNRQKGHSRTSGKRR